MHASGLPFGRLASGGVLRQSSGGGAINFGAGRLVVGSVIVALFVGGCAVHYYDKSTGTEHLWGFGHMKMRAVPQWNDQHPFSNSVMAFATGAHTLGLGLGCGDDYGGLLLGWDCRSRMIIRTEDSHFYLLWPTNTCWLPWDLKERFFTVRVGPELPFTNGLFVSNSNPANK
jgi:hypothetical protein